MIPSKIGPYEIRAEIGIGGMATVYRAYQPTVDRDVAIKVLRQDGSDSQSLQRLQREARLIARLEHPNILPVYDFVVDHQPPFIVMRYADGGTLKDLMSRPALSFEGITGIIRQIAAALDYAHGQRIIHRDIKPSNILLDRTGNILVADFGFARRAQKPGDDTSHSTDITLAGTITGTPGYMSPEQGLGSDNLTAQTDLYALGVIFFEMVTGQPPYRAENSISLILRHIHDPIPVATALNSRLTVEIDDLVARALAKDPGQRFDSAGLFAQAVTNAFGRIPDQSENSGIRAGAASRKAKLEDRNAGKQRLPMHLSLSVLGSIQVSLNGQPITGFEYDKVRALLIYLVMEPDQAHRRETLAEMLWPDQPDQVGRDNLRQALSTLRKAIGDAQAEPPFLLISRETLQFNRDSQFTLDSEEFTQLFELCDNHNHARLETCGECIQRLEKATQLYRGDFAQGLVLPDNETFQNWLAFEREKFHDRALNALYSVADYHQRQGAYDLARRLSWRQIELEPWREEAYRQLMILLALSGQRTEALGQYERCCRVLTNELGLEPAAETQALYEQIRAGEIKPAIKYTDQTAIVRRTNLPIALTSFVGREKELARILQYLADPPCRLLTITGLGGMGKTRLALEAARQSERLFQNACFISLSALNTPDLIPSAIAEGLQFFPTNQDNLASQLVVYLSDKNFLLTLDNLEQLTGDLTLLTEIATHAPGVKLLLTAREKLNLQGEWVFSLNGLPIAIEDRKNGSSSAIALFEHRARMVYPEFVTSEQNLADIERICKLVDGMPLGIELAAAWVNMLSCREIADSITSDLGFLTASTQGVSERHKSLRGVFEYSWKLLTAEQQRIFRALAVFRGGFHLDAALEVAGASLSTLLIFVNKSLLIRDQQGRYHVHELIRQYALEKLHQSGESEETYTRHLRYFVAFAETAEPYLQGGQQLLWLERLEAENDNIRTALEWSLVNQVAEMGLRLATSLWRHTQVRNFIHESPEWLEKLLEAAPNAPIMLRAKALFVAGWLAQSRRDIRLAVIRSEESLLLARQIGDELAIAYPLSTLAWLAYFQGDYRRSAELGEESLMLFRQAKDLWGVIRCLNILGFIAESQAQLAQADAFQEEATMLARGAGDNDTLGWAILLLARVKAERGQYEEAIALCNEALEIYRELRNQNSIGLAYYTLAETALALGQYEQAMEYGKESVTLMREISDLWAVGGPLSCLGMVAYRQGNLEDAQRYSEESRATFVRFGDKRGMTYAINTLGCVAQARGDYTKASAFFTQSLALRQEANIRHGMEVCFERLAELASQEGDFIRAAELLGAAERVRREIEIPMPQIDVQRIKENIHVLRRQLGDAQFEAAWARGVELLLSEAIGLALKANEM